MKYVSINGQRIRQNVRRAPADCEPPIRIAKSRSDTKPLYANEIRIEGPAAWLRYSPNSPLLRCGARMVLECVDVTVLR